MKLVDILARELKVWPEESTCDYCCQSDSTTEVFFGHPAGRIFLSERADETEDVIVTRAQWQAAVDALKSAVPEWNGEGLPPVGIDVQMSHGIAQVTAYSPDNKWAFLWVAASNLPSLIRIDDPAMFRPIRTPEQIAYAERVWNEERARIKGTDEIYAVLFGHGGASRADLARAIYDAGYRKFEIVDN